MKSTFVFRYGGIVVGIAMSFAFLFGYPSMVSATCDKPDLAQSLEQQRAVCQAELDQIQAEINQKEKELAGQKANSATLSRDVTVLQTQIEQAKLKIKEKNGKISQISGDISKKNETINALTNELGREKKSLSQIIKKKNELDQYTIFEFLLSSKTISDFFHDEDSFEFIQGALQDSFYHIRKTQGQTEKEKLALQEKKAQETDLKFALESDKKEVEQKETEKKGLLSVSKGKEKSYEQVIKERQAQASKIRSRLFELAGGVKGGGIPFGDAVRFAKEAQGKTGVRAAFILGVLKQETNLGSNVGTCNRPGDVRKWNTPGVMPGPQDKATGRSGRDDQSIFVQIVQKLGMSPEGLAISCPLPGAGGWGGAMGPSQFIPSTWRTYAPRIEAALGVPAANPWNPEQAIMATALYMKDLGAATGGFTAERDAACKYYSGRGCSAPGVRNLFYGDAVMSFTAKFESDIQFIEEN